MPTARANGIRIEYETFGKSSDRPLLLIMGLGAQMILWEEAFCEQLAQRGHCVIRFDNRDVGRSTQFDECGVPDVMKAVGRALIRQPIEAPYLLSDMAADAVGLLDALDIERADVVGASMGGMIAQSVAIEYPSRTRTLTSIMSTTGNADLPPPKPEAMAALMTPAPLDRAGSIERAVGVFRVIGSPGLPFDADRIRRIAGQAYDRGFNPAGTIRQLVAILASGSRKEALRSVRVPALVVHGAADPLISVAGGIDTAEAIPGAEVLILEGMGHDLPPVLWPQIVDAISGLTARA